MGQPVKVLVACEYSGVVRDAFRERGHEAWSCDLLPTDVPGPHYQGDVLEILALGWDLMIAHPPCTHLAVSGARHFAAKRADGRQQGAIEFFMALANAPVKRKAIENPVCIMSSHWRKPDQIIQPWMFGHGETKATCLWLENLPLLKPTDVVEGREARVHRLPPTADRRPLEDPQHNLPRHRGSDGRAMEQPVKVHLKHPQLYPAFAPATALSAGFDLGVSLDPGSLMRALAVTVAMAGQWSNP